MPLKIYYIDDEVDLCDNFVDEFESTQVRVTTFSNPELAIAATKKDPPDIIFVDFRLPGTTGDKIAKAMPENIPKYLITGDFNVKAEYKFEAMLGKPCKVKDIQLILDGYLKRRA